jgi:O-succinylbenzoic acid--CoA ligase
LIPEDFVTSLVPTQLQYLLDHHPQFLQQFRVIFLGGAPAWPELLTQARNLHINLAPTYGMTETAGQVATLLPTDFLQGRNSVGKILPHVTMTMLEPLNSSSKRKTTKSNEVKSIAVISDALFLGYYPSLGDQFIFYTGDLGCFKQKYLHVVGRYNRRIISGGKNIDPLEIETWLLDQNLVKDIVIVGIDDRRWGEAVTAIYVPQDQVNPDQIIQALKTHFAPHKCPKHWLPVPEIRRSPLGKIKYTELQLWAKKEIDKRPS